ncbi:MAG: hypothetical protein A2075_12460 [Geobacteraceae bacterium GWC2_58_44]|nr:MAG: hypothetical protein A2075_12460 [Geobacteraceae bacterium GWC2_58_44]HBG06904.1 hypothetical protein [Geobacter sp.]
MHNVKNNAASTLGAQLLINSTSMVVAADVFPVVPFYLTLADSEGLSLEVVEVTDKTGTTLTVIRGVEGADQTHPVGRPVELRMMAQHLVELQDAAAVVRPRGDWVSDTINLREANASGKKVQLAAGTFYLEGDGNEIIRKTNTASWDGAGLGSTFLMIRANVPNTRDVFRLTPKELEPMGYKNRGFQLSNFAIIPESGKPGRYAIHLDVDDVYEEIEGEMEIVEANWFTSQFHFHHLHLDYCGGRSIRLSNTLPKMDGYFCGKVTDCLIWSGIQCIGGGDSLQFLGNTLAGENWGLECLLRDLANVVAIRDNNITARGGALRLYGDRFKITDNNIELYENGGTAPAVTPAAIVQLIGGKQSELSGNTIMNIVGNSSAACQLDNCDRAKLTHNRFHGGAVGNDLVVASSCTNTFLYPDNHYYNARKVDSGTNTTYV